VVVVEHLELVALDDCPLVEDSDPKLLIGAESRVGSCNFAFVSSKIIKEDNMSVSQIQCITSFRPQLCSDIMARETDVMMFRLDYLSLQG
jgi:hypothetical protein